MSSKVPIVTVGSVDYTVDFKGMFHHKRMMLTSLDKKKVLYVHKIRSKKGKVLIGSAVRKPKDLDEAQVTVCPIHKEHSDCSKCRLQKGWFKEVTEEELEREKKGEYKIFRRKVS